MNIDDTSTSTSTSTSSEPQAQVLVVSFGYGHAPAPTADLVLDVRRRLRNPHHDPAVRGLTGRDEAVRQQVLATPGARRLITHAAAMARDLLTDAGQPVICAVGCVGGRHRSHVLADEIGAELRAAGVSVVVRHRDENREVLPSGTHELLDQPDTDGTGSTQHLPRALGGVVRAAQEAQKQAYAHHTHPKDAARAFHDATGIGMSLLDLASAIRFHIHDIVEDPDIDLTDTQRRAYEEVHAEFNYLAKRCIDLSTGMNRAATALDRLTEPHPDAKI